ncbi:uncharacterized protein LOC126896543 isoform X1 [Daktulosphaira vitifoliae]|uniref:uncharacterized protein LOC126896543 isoform X1 n=1 Tax=Daktulosphaira vitifoliae TaxID=58002 RepID=UPI0021A98C65|nr:uncharacterized protein LOC126896543 isoform X1 [Daktulosphaira vitifoliae]
MTYEQAKSKEKIAQESSDLSEIENMKETRKNRARKEFSPFPKKAQDKLKIKSHIKPLKAFKNMVVAENYSNHIEYNHVSDDDSLKDPDFKLRSPSPNSTLESINFPTETELVTDKLNYNSIAPNKYTSSEKNFQPSTQKKVKVPSDNEGSFFVANTDYSSLMLSSNRSGCSNGLFDAETCCCSFDTY